MKEIYKEFTEVKGEYLDEIPGQARFAYGTSGMEDCFEVEDIIKHDGYYKGSVIRFYDYKTGKVYLPFEHKKNISYGKTIYIVASKQEQVEKAVEIFRERYPKVMFAGYRNGYFASEDDMDGEAKHIAAVNPDFLIVGMGALMQEKFLLKVKKAGFQGVGFTCGGFIHQTSKNEIDYYPAWVDKTNLRFVYRMWKEPHTRKRYLKAGLLFPTRFVLEKIFG